MGMLTLTQVPPVEAASFYGPFLAMYPDGRVGMHLQAQASELEALCAWLSESGAMFRYAEGRWTVKGVIGHLLDTERVFGYRLLRISRGDVTPMPGFDETSYVPAGQFNQRSVNELVSEFTLQRVSRPREWRPFSRVASHRDCEWLPHERSRARLHHSWAYRTSSWALERALSPVRDTSMTPG